MKSIFFILACSLGLTACQKTSIVPPSTEAQSPVLQDKRPCKLEVIKASRGLKVWQTTEDERLIIHAKNNIAYGKHRIQMLYTQGILPQKTILRVYQGVLRHFRISNHTITLDYNMIDDMQTFYHRYSDKNTSTSIVDINSGYWCQPFSANSNEHGPYTDFIIGREILEQLSLQLQNDKKPMIIQLDWNGQNLQIKQGKSSI